MDQVQVSVSEAAARDGGEVDGPARRSGEMEEEVDLKHVGQGVEGHVVSRRAGLAH